MMWSLLTKTFWVLFASVALVGCIADNAEEGDLPWASTKSWEGLAPVVPTLMDRYD